MVDGYIPLDKESNLVLARTGEADSMQVTLRIKQGVGDYLEVPLSVEVMNELGYHMCLMYYWKTRRYAFTPQFFKAPDPKPPVRKRTRPL